VGSVNGVKTSDLELGCGYAICSQTGYIIYIYAPYLILKKEV
jgi:hypothetical protein